MQAAIDEVLEQDDDLSAMYLSEWAVRARSRDDHQEVEMLLESFSKQVEEIVNEVDSLVVSYSILCLSDTRHAAANVNVVQTDKCPPNAGCH